MTASRGPLRGIGQSPRIALERSRRVIDELLPADSDIARHAGEDIGRVVLDQSLADDILAPCMRPAYPAGEAAPPRDRTEALP